MSKDTFYFSHDSNAHTDPKMLRLRMSLGWEGYGLFWAITECLRSQSNYFLSEEDFSFLTLALAIDEAKLNQIKSKFLEIGLLVLEDGKIFSPSLMKRMEKADKLRNIRSESGKKGGRPPKKESESAPPKIEEEQEGNKSESNSTKELKEQFDQFRVLYKGTKGGLNKEFEALKKHKDWKEIVPKLEQALQYQSQARRALDDAGDFCPNWKNLSTWMNQRCWEDEIAQPLENEKTKPNQDQYKKDQLDKGYE